MQTTIQAWAYSTGLVTVGLAGYSGGSSRPGLRSPGPVATSPCCVPNRATSRACSSTSQLASTSATRPVRRPLTRTRSDSRRLTSRARLATSSRPGPPGANAIPGSEDRGSGWCSRHGLRRTTATTTVGFVPGGEDRLLYPANSLGVADDTDAQEWQPT